MQEFCDTIFKYCDTGYVEFRALPTNGVGYRKQVFHKLGGPLPALPNGTNWYVGTATRRAIDGKIAGRTEYLHQFPALWVDCDTPESVDALARFQFLPTLEIETSPGRKQAWWLLDEPADPEDSSTVAATVRAIAEYLGGDLKATDLARVLRLPGTVNYKYSPAHQVAICNIRKEYEYSLRMLYDELSFSTKRISFCVGDEIRDMRGDCKGGEKGEEKGNGVGLEGVCRQASSTGVVERLKMSPLSPQSSVSSVSSCRVRQNMFDSGSRDDDLFHTALHLAKGFMPSEEIRQVLLNLVLSWGETQPEHRTEEWVAQKVKSAMDFASKRERNLAADVREWVLSSHGVFLISDVATCLQVSTREDRKNMSRALSRLVDSGVIQRTGNRNGQFRLVEAAVDTIDWQNASSETPWDVKYPFGIERFYMTLPKNIVMVDGATDSGKTAFLLNFAYENVDRFGGRIHYFSSEMGPVELKCRLERFENPSRFDGVRFLERSQGFADVIRPNDINIVDYLEISDEFWKVGGVLREIHDRLDTGICLIARQKLPGAKAGRGGEFGKEKARLVLLMDPGEITINKCKNWRDPEVNPNGKSWKFRLVGGCKFVYHDTPEVEDEPTDWRDM